MPHHGYTLAGAGADDPTTFAHTTAESTISDSDGNDGGSDGGGSDGSGRVELRAVGAAHGGSGGSDRLRLPAAYSAEEVAAVVRKLDRRLVLFVALLYLLSFLDRSNIGNARIAGLEAELGRGWYDWALTAFYLSYISFEWMALLWRFVPAHAYVAILVATWGTVASLQAVAPSWPVLLALRFVMGIAEAGFSSMPLYLSFFFRPDELAFRTAIFIAAAPLASSFASMLAWLIVQFANDGPISPWRLLFLIEGFPSVLIAVVAWHLIPDSPQTAPFLSRRERKVAMLRLRDAEPSEPALSTLASVVAVLRDPAAWLTAAMMFAVNVAFASLPVFMPKILTEMGYRPVAAQILTAPPYLVAVVSILATALLSDRLRSRSVPLALHALASAGAYAIMSLAGPLGLSAWVRYGAVVVAAAGFFNSVVLILTWATNNQATPAHRGAGYALMSLVGQCGPLLGTRLYPDADAPLYANGMEACAIAMFFVFVLTLILRELLARRNAALEADFRIDDSDGESEGLVGTTGHKNMKKGFRYML